MATLWNERKLTAAARENQEGSPRKSQSRTCPQKKRGPYYSSVGKDRGQVNLKIVPGI